MLEQKEKECKRCGFEMKLKGYGLCPKCYAGKYTEFQIKKKQSKTDAKTFRQFMIGSIKMPDDFNETLKKLKQHGKKR